MNPTLSFGIDTEELTFGLRNPTYSVRLYYPDVGVVKCKIVFEERKVCTRIVSFRARAFSVESFLFYLFQVFLVVLGANSLTVDGCKE